MNSPIGWIGGKRALRKEIIALFPQDGVGRYIEVFFGAGWVFFGREKQPGQLEVINDRDGQIVNLFRCIVRTVHHARDRGVRFQSHAEPPVKRAGHSHPR